MQKNLAQKNVAISEVNSFLGSTLTEFFLKANYHVWGLGPLDQSSKFLGNPNFTFLEFNLDQPLPSHLPDFDMILYLEPALFDDIESEVTGRHHSPALTHSLEMSKKTNGRLFIFAKITKDYRFFEHLIRDRSVKNRPTLFLIGDLYGPEMPLVGSSKIDSLFKNQLTSLISQAVLENKVILEHEGMEFIYPLYVSDLAEAIDHFVINGNVGEVESIISESPKTALAVAYEVQNILNLVTDKQVGLFFAGAKPKKIDAKGATIGNVNFSPKVGLKEGLQNTFEFFKNENMIKTGANVQRPVTLTREERLKKIIDENAPQKTPEKEIGINSPGGPKSKLKKRIRVVFFGLVVLLVVTLGKVAVDVAFGADHLKNAKNQAFSGDFEKAKVSSRKSKESFESAGNIFKYLSLGKVRGVNSLIESATNGSLAFNYFIEGSEVLARDYTIITSKDPKGEGFDLEAPEANFRRGYFAATVASELAKEASAFPLLSAKIKNAQISLNSLAGICLTMYDLTRITDDLVGTSEPKSYLVLLENNSELRPGGGFIGNFALIEFSGGRLKDITVEDIYAIDGQLKEKIAPPKELKEKLGVDNFYLRDSNWSTDFSLNAQTARDFFRKETGKEVDGVIAIDLTFIQNLLSKLGPVKLDDYGETIDAQNLFDRGEYHSEVGFFPGSTQKKEFFSALTRTLISQMLENPKNAWLPLVESIGSGLSEKHLMISLTDPALSPYVKVHGWDHPLPPIAFNPAEDNFETRDFLALSEANLGANKANRFLERKISYEMTIGRDADLIAKLTINYQNNSQADTWPAGPYVNFLRVYAPVGAGLISVQNGDVGDIKTVETSTTTSLTTFATFIEVPPKSSKEITLTYRISKSIKLESAPIYHLYVQKQPGTEKDPFEFTFNLPNYLVDKETGKQNLKVATDLLVDRQFQFEIAKK